MRARAALAAVALATLSGCPLPQPLAELGNGNTVIPPRILVDQVVPSGTRLLVSKSCTGAVFGLRVAVSTVDFAYPVVEVRWFVDYDPQTSWGVFQVDPLTLSSDAPVGEATFAYHPPPYDAARPLGHVVEVVVSNGFFQLGDDASALPNRTARPGFETQLYRWVFEYDDAGTCPQPQP